MLTYGLTDRPIMGRAECPFCAWVPAGRSIKDHIKRCHPERMVADRAYQQARTDGRTIEDARAIYNAIVLKAVQRVEGYRV